MNIYIKYLFLLLVIMLAGCGNDKAKQPIPVSDSTTEFTIPARTDLFGVLATKNYYDIEFLKAIISKRLLEQDFDNSAQVRIVTSGDSLLIDQARIILENTDFTITLTASDSTGYIVRVGKSILKGGSIYQVLTDLGMAAGDVGIYAWEMGEYIDATSIDVGDKFSITYFTDDKGDKHFEKFTYQPDKTSIHEFYFAENLKLRYNLVELPYELIRRLVKGTISEQYSTWDAAMNALDIIPYIRQQANNAMDSQIAFATDARIGDEFEVYIEEKHVNGERQSRGKLLYAKYSGKYTKTKTAYRFSDDDEASAYTGMYTTEAKRLVTDAVRTPLDRMHVTSPFGYRIHPVYGYRRMHNGMDLRGSTGTPVYAVTNGTVTKATNNGNGYGKEVLIKHDNGMITQYAHLSKISTTRGKKVKKGQLIGKIGSTGVSTGPHLHFGVKKNGRWVNPRTNLKMVGANVLKDARLKTFKKQMEEMDAEMAILQ
ncbi:MAG: M23 family metallopeptidase [Candidatus Cloacimonetes bacterium]|nr:M23 family metallopeptidase [Candidatus Cloacimonadota bacterium]